MDPQNSSLITNDTVVVQLNTEGPPPGIQETVLAGGEKKAPLIARVKQKVYKSISQVATKKRIGEITSELAVMADPVQDQIKRIKERNPEELVRNANRVEQAITEWYVADKMVTYNPSGLEKLLGRLPGKKPENRFQKELSDKAARFQGEYEQTIFAHVEHSTKALLPEEVELKSPAFLARESGTNIKDNYAHSGAEDIAMGNTDYIFACFYDLPSRTFSQRGPNYEIASQDGYVVPVDQADLKIPESMLVNSEDIDTRRADYRTKHYKMYADNIYTLKDFKRVFSYFSAAFFDKPQDAVDFFKRYGESMDIARVDFWESSNHWGQGGMSKDAVTIDNNKLAQMRQLVINKSIFPPFAPEVQFKDKVKARKKTA